MSNSTLEELRKRKLLTVGDVIRALQEYPPDMKVASMGADCGGYDVSVCNYLSLEVWESEDDSDEDRLMFSHLEVEAYEDHKKGEISYKEYEEFS